MPNEFFNALDYIYILLTLASTMMGFLRGFTHDFFSSCAWFGSGFLSNLLAPHLAPIVRKYVASRIVADSLAWLVAYLVMLACSMLIVGVLSKNVKQSIFSSMDRAIGILFGLFRGVAIPVCFCLALISLKIPKNEYPLLKESKLSSILFALMESSSPSTAADSVKSIKNKGIALQKMKHAPLKTKKLVGKISSSKPKKALSEKNRISLNRIKDWIVGILVKYYGESSPAEESTEIEEEQKQEPAASKIEEKEKAPYGVMSIVEARARRRAERKAALLKKKIRRRLDSDER